MGGWQCQPCDGPKNFWGGDVPPWLANRGGRVPPVPPSAAPMGMPQVKHCNMNLESGLGYKDLRNEQVF